MKKIITEIAVTADVKGLVELEETCFETDRLSARQYRYFIKKPTALVISARHGSSVIAAAVVLFRKNSRIARLYSLAVHPDYRQRGLAAELNEFAEKCARRFHCHEIRLEVRKDNRKAIRFYEKHGYTHMGEYRKFYEDGADALRMRKLLD